MSLARQHREQLLALTTASAPAMGSGLAPLAADTLPGGEPVFSSPTPSTAAQHIALRLTHDLRRLKEIKSVANKVAAKREMLPAYAAWCDGLLEAGRLNGSGELSPTGADEVLPTIMVWSIDVGDWSRALELASLVLRFGVPLPARYQRDAATLVLEEVAEAALKLQAQGKPFPLHVLEQVEELVAGVDMHDEPRAKLLKAIGTELARAAEAAEGEAAHPLLLRAVERLGAAQGLHDRIGVKTRIAGLQKAIDALQVPTDPAGDPAA